MGNILAIGIEQIIEQTLKHKLSLSYELVQCTLATCLSTFGKQNETASYKLRKETCTRRTIWFVLAVVLRTDTCASATTRLKYERNQWSKGIRFSDGVFDFWRKAMQLRVNGLPADASEDELARLFSEIGRLEWVRIIRDVISGKSKGYAIVRMPIDVEAEEAIKRLNGSKLENVLIKVNKMPETLPGEMEYKEWLTDYASSALGSMGVMDGQSVLDYGCGPGPFSFASAGTAW